MAIPESIERALHTANPYEELRAVATALFAVGQTKQAVYDMFEAARGQLRLEARGADEDVIMDVMDCLVGWCNPHQELTSAEEKGIGHSP